MAATVRSTNKRLPATPWGYLPPRMRVLFVAGSQRMGGWLADAFAADTASEVVLHEAVGMAVGVERLRDEVFDAVLISHELPDLDAFELLDAIPAGVGEDQPIVVLGTQGEQELAAICYEAGADAYVCLGHATTRSLIWTVARAIERRRLIAGSRRMQQAEEHRRKLEQDEANRLLAQQKGLLNDEHPLPEEINLPEGFAGHYRDLLRTYVIMGAGNLADEIRQLVRLLTAGGVTARETMSLHLRVVEEMIQGLGNRSARHVMNRADMLILEVMMRLAGDYQQRYVEEVRPLNQLSLPGFNRFAAAQASKDNSTA